MDIDILTFSAVINYIRPGQKFSVRGNDGQTTGFTASQITWDDVGIPPTDAELEAGFIQMNDPDVITTGLRDNAINQLTVDTSSTSKLIRAILLTLIDEINVIRAVLPIPLVPITDDEAKTKVEAKINSGEAD